MANQYTTNRWIEFDQAYSPEPNSGCWLWLGALNAKGYGSIRIAGKTELAHRMSYRRYRGEVAAGVQVLHRCDVPACINPDHLYLGTHADNMRDMSSRNRHPYRYGEAHHNAKLSQDDVCAIRASFDNYTSLARRYGITKDNIYSIRARKTWRHVP
jgi:hypothetical protein